MSSSAAARSATTAESAIARSVPICGTATAFSPVLKSTSTDPAETYVGARDASAQTAVAVVSTATARIGRRKAQKRLVTAALVAGLRSAAVWLMVDLL